MTHRIDSQLVARGLDDTRRAQLAALEAKGAPNEVDRGALAALDLHARGEDAARTRALTEKWAGR